MDVHPLRLWRQEQKLTLEAFGQQIGVKRSTLSLYETGRRIPRPRIMEQIRKASISGKLMGQLEFARFIEENAVDVSAPPAADLIETVRDLQAHRKVNFTKAVRTSSDNENFEFTVETEATSRNGGVEIPTRFELALPVYFGEPITPLYAFLRWKLDEGALQLGIQLHRAEHVRQASFRLIASDIAERTGCPVVYGRI